MGDCLVSRTMSRHFEVRVSSVTDCSRILFASASAVLVCFFCSATRVFADSAWSSLTRAWVASSKFTSGRVTERTSIWLPTRSCISSCTA